MCLFYVILPVACLNKFIERYINKIDYITVDRGDGMSDDAEEDKHPRHTQHKRQA